MAKFSPGDPVWIRRGFDDWGRLAVAKETPGTVLELFLRTELRHLAARCNDCGSDTLHIVDAIPQLGVCGCRLRPRRDDYQQHEGLGSRDELTKSVAPDLTEASLQELCEELMVQRG